MIWFTEPVHIDTCTVVESFHGDVKLIKRSHESRLPLATLRFPSLKACLEYAEQNQCQINIVYSGRKRVRQGDFGPKSSSLKETSKVASR